MDLFDDILSEPSTALARAGGRFQPKVKPRHKKQSVLEFHLLLLEILYLIPPFQLHPQKFWALPIQCIQRLLFQMVTWTAVPSLASQWVRFTWAGICSGKSGRLETEEAKAFSCLEPLEIMSEVTATSGKTIGKYLQDSSMVHSEAQYRSEVGPVFAGSPHVVPDFPSLSHDDAFSTDSIAECLLNQVTVFEHGESWKRKTSTGPDSTRKYQDGGLAHDHDDSLEEAPDESVAVEDETNNDDYREQKKVRKSPSVKSNKVSENDKPARTCKKTAEAPRKSAKNILKILSFNQTEKKMRGQVPA
ncbi:hypothetical protein Nepgr_002026 [Nepenthes gracilis]|uniref:Uncharacterized protein n=1 Tax=Nepenthes gracilis TaxID=150966 RepID=A0AAD3P9H0_NEPGR|nr:hypothetical protein Nepgr_002026 [Nepenthes gracilis]